MMRSRSREGWRRVFNGVNLAALLVFVFLVLSLYWMMANVISLVIQIWINHTSLGKELHELGARRAARKKGSIAQRPLARR